MITALQMQEVRPANSASLRPDWLYLPLRADEVDAFLAARGKAVVCPASQVWSSSPRQTVVGGKGTAAMKLGEQSRCALLIFAMFIVSGAKRILQIHEEMAHQV